MDRLFRSLQNPRAAVNSVLRRGKRAKGPTERCQSYNILHSSQSGARRSSDCREVAHLYIQLHTITTPLDAALRDSRGGLEPFDGIAEVWWESLEVVQRSLADPEAQAAWAALIEDEKLLYLSTCSVPHCGLGKKKSCSQSRRRQPCTAQRAHANVSPRRDVIPRDRCTGHDAARPFSVKVLRAQSGYTASGGRVGDRTLGVVGHVLCSHTRTRVSVQKWLLKCPVRTLDGGMARSLRVEYAGAYYHVMARGNRREEIFG